jgi:hypothetical protein
MRLQFGVEVTPIVTPMRVEVTPMWVARKKRNCGNKIKQVISENHPPHYLGKRSPPT